MSDAITEFFLASSPSVAMLDTLELSHPSWPEPLRFVRNDYAGFDGMADGSMVRYEFAQCAFKAAGIADDLDYRVEVQVAVGPEVSALFEGADLTQPATAVYRAYRSDSVEPLRELPLTIDEVIIKRDIVQFTAQAPQLNSTAVGERYDLDRFVGLRDLV